MSAPWTTDYVDQLRTMWDGPMSAAEIGRVLGMTRNAILGKVHRLDLPTRPRSGRRPSKSARVNPYPPKVKRNVDNLRAACGKVGNAGQTRSPRPVAIAPCQPPLMLGLMSLTDESCRFPIGDPGQPDFGFCGHQSAPRSSYCAGHSHLCGGRALAWA